MTLYQKSVSLPVTGFVGTLTRAKINDEISKNKLASLNGSKVMKSATTTNSEQTNSVTDVLKKQDEVLRQQVHIKEQSVINKELVPTTLASSEQYIQISGGNILDTSIKNNTNNNYNIKGFKFNLISSDYTDEELSNIDISYKQDGGSNDANINFPAYFPESSRKSDHFIVGSHVSFNNIPLSHDGKIIAKFDGIESSPVIPKSLLKVLVTPTPDIYISVKTDSSGNRKTSISKIPIEQQEAMENSIYDKQRTVTVSQKASGEITFTPENFDWKTQSFEVTLSSEDYTQEELKKITVNLVPNNSEPRDKENQYEILIGNSRSFSALINNISNLTHEGSIVVTLNNVNLNYLHNNNPVPKAIVKGLPLSLIINVSKDADQNYYISSQKPKI